MCMFDPCSLYALSRDMSKRCPLNDFVRSSKAVLSGAPMKVMMTSFDVHRSIFRFQTNFNGIIIDTFSARLHFINYDWHFKWNKHKSTHPPPLKSALLNIIQPSGSFFSCIKFYYSFHNNSYNSFHILTS